jgi:gliding motility-associated-like protein
LAVRDTMTIFFTPAPLVNAGPDIFVCKTNPNAPLNVICSTGSGTWTTSGTGSFNPNNTVLNPTYIPSTADTTAGSVTLVFTSGNNGSCNAVKDTVKIIYSAPPTLTAAISSTVACSNSPVALTGLSSTGSATWTTSGTGLFAPNTMTGNYIPSASDGTLGIVTLTMTSTNNGGCVPVSASITLSVIPGPTANAGSNITVCANTTSIALSGSVTIASGGMWSSSGTGTFNPSATTMTTGYFPSGADTTAGSILIFLTTTGNGNCNAYKDTLKVTFVGAPQVNAGADIFVCKNSPNVLLNGISSVATHTWTTLGSGSFNPNNTILNPTYNSSPADTTAGTVSLVLSAGGTGVCGTVRDTVKIFYQGQPKANFSFANKCVNAITTFTDLSTVASGTITSWAWNFGSVSTSTVQNPTNTFTATGSQTVTLVVSTGCLDSITKVLYVNSLPSASFTAMSLCHDSAQFAGMGTVSPGNISTWNWNFGDTTFSAQQNPIHVYKDTGNYIVTITVMSDSSCISSFTDTLYIKKCNNDFIVSNPAVPSAFTPNGDGLNDVLLVKGGPFNSVDFRVFNEWGNQIFHSTDASVGWDGKTKGSPSQSGRYIWTLNCEVIDGRAVKLAGEVILTR